MATSNSPETPSWLVVGGEVIVKEAGTHGEMSRATVAKVTKTRVVLDTGEAFSTRSLYRIGSSTWSFATLLNPDDPEVRIDWLEYLQRRLRRMIEVKDLLAQFERDGDIALAVQAQELLGKTIERYQKSAALIESLGEQIKGQ